MLIPALFVMMSIPPRDKVQAEYQRAPLWPLAPVFAAGLLTISCATSTTLIEAPGALLSSATSTCRRTVADGSLVAPRVSWLVNADASRRSVLDRWCATVGPAVFANASSAPPDDDSFAIITWNVHVGGGSLRALVTALQEGRAVEGVKIRRFALLLQEALRMGEDLAAELLGRAGPDFFQALA